MKMKTIQLKKHKTKHLNEIFQSIDIKFSLLTQTDENSYQQVHVEGKCRDFLGDCLWAKETGGYVYIYGFEYEYAKAPYDSDMLKLSCHFPTEEDKENFVANFYKHIHPKEKKAGVERLSEVFEVDGDKETLVVVADPSWLTSPWRLSLYTFFIKEASYVKGEPLREPEDAYKVVLTKPIELKLLRNVTKAPAIFHKDLDNNHNYSGFISVIKNTYNKCSEDHAAIFGGTK